ncbi:MAG: MBL fold metallo-hydrolase [Clostridia bacterium]|nr:MBL fold metallo-hydrolase [Clostridia bacterium]
MKQKKKQSPFEKGKTPFNELVLKGSIALFIAVVFVGCFVFCGGTQIFEKSIYVDSYQNYEFQLHTIDVENGDAFLLRLPENKTMLIDCGDSQYQDRVVSYIQQFLRHEGLKQIDYLVLTHSDSDHVGNASAVIKKFKVKNVYRPKIYAKDEAQYASTEQSYKTDDSKIYNDAIISAYQNGCNIIFNQEGVSISLNNCTVEFLSPRLESYADDNDYSAVIMIKYYSTKLLFMGDASAEIEQDLILQYGDNLQADILKVGHHGSKTATSEDFLHAVRPAYAILSCSENSKILPHSEVLTRLETKQIQVFSTMKLGNFTLTISENAVCATGQVSKINFWTIVFSVLLIFVVVMFKIPFFHKKALKNL